MEITNDVESPTRPKGKYKAVVICWILGLGTLVSWNSMMTVGDYYYKVYPKYHPSRVLSAVYQPFALGGMFILAYNESKINTRRRNLAGFSLYVANTLAVLVIDLATSGKGGLVAYICLCVVACSFGIADALAQGGMTGDLSLMCPEFIQAYYAGLAASGALTSALRLITKAAFEKSENGLRKGAVLFLAVSILLVVLSIFLYAFIFPRLSIVKYYRSKAALEGSKTVCGDLLAAGIRTQDHVQGDAENQGRLSLKQLLYQNIDYLMNVLLVCLVSLSIVPGFLYENTGTHALGDWYALVLISMFNVGDLISRYFPVIKGPNPKSRKGITIATIARFLFIPAFYFTAKYGSEGWMIMVTSFFGLTNGYLIICIFTAAPEGYKGPEQNAIGNLLSLSLVCGLSLGVALSWLWLIGNGSF